MVSAHPIPFTPIAPMFSWSLGAVRFLKIAKALLFKDAAIRAPPVRRAVFCRKSLRESIVLKLV
jgi:hypothetical protein